MLAALALILAAASLGVSLTLAVRLRALGERIDRRSLPIEKPGAPLPEPNVLNGLRIALDVRQDHPNAPFSARLRERLLSEDAILEPESEVVKISGQVVCNGYADVYYRADLAIHANGQPLFTLVEKPPHGDRPDNLALELVERLKLELRKRERQAALREL